ncbi:hypothetical protein F5144DRAFT_604698 [Chaetomium tenue]|uniref:Uncharacterized protein n=1 Tax=Chaetomium tenue TaxID=1854479 RepID=A0ACB7P5R8_9PEZI|nr:hypothetical protein F5144DRAFT_604698 [Chaetomium globosum]
MAFFEGTLQEGIAAALQQSKSVMCFVTDGEAESQTWELRYFLDETLRPMLESNAVSLRLVAGSQEEGFLKQLYPVPQKPTVVIIRDGQLKEYIAAGASKEDFLKRMKVALTPTESTPDQPLPSQATPLQPPVIPAPDSATNQASHAEESSSSSSGQAIPPSTTNSRVQSMLAARAARVLEQKKKDEAEAKRQGAEKGKAKDEAGASVPKKTDEQSKHAAALKKKQREAREERERILKAIEDDKVARKAQREEEAAARRMSMVSEKPDLAALTKVSSSAGRLSEHCAIQARLFDGSTIRHRFSSSDTLTDVRKWVDENRGDSKDAYSFKVLLTPLPSKTIDVTEEDKSLQALELAPSSTLILLRVPKFKVAYSTSPGPAAGEPQGNIFQRLIAYFLAIITGFFSTISAFVSSFLSMGGPSGAPGSSTAQATGSQSQVAADAARRRAGRIAGMDHAEGRRNDQQFYNGNSTNFQPRSDDGE